MMYEPILKKARAVLRKNECKKWNAPVAIFMTRQRVITSMALKPELLFQTCQMIGFVQNVEPKKSSSTQLTKTLLLSHLQDVLTHSQYKK